MSSSVEVDDQILDETEEVTNEEPAVLPDGYEMTLMGLCGCTQCEQDLDPNRQKPKKVDWSEEEQKHFQEGCANGLLEIVNPQQRYLTIGTLTEKQ
ncbi:MAG: hypothetical protein GY795_06140 [Desulfobacterales bacterium]|nr:hypothetical protein [Desulfobacterales bacterium]